MSMLSMVSAEDLPEQRTGKLITISSSGALCTNQEEVLSIYQALIAFNAGDKLQSFIVLERLALKTLP